MTITLSWDLFVIVFFGLVITYSFIIGKHEAVKIVIATYIATVAVEGLGNIIERVSGDSQPILSVLGMEVQTPTLTGIKLIMFVALIIFIAIRSGMEIEYSKDTRGPIDTVITALFGIATAGLLLSTLLTYVANVPLLDTQLMNTIQVTAIGEQSKLMQIMIRNQDLWYAMPALLLLAVGFLSNSSKE